MSIRRVLEAQHKDIISISRVEGGSLAEAFDVRTATHHLFVKSYPPTNPLLVHIETEGLKALHASSIMHVPKVYWHTGQIVVMQWISQGDPPLIGHAARKLGELLAKLHGQKVDGYALPWGNAIGMPQPASPLYQDAGTFYIEERLRPLLESLPPQWGLLCSDIKGLFPQIARFLSQHQSPPALLHGDLWSGNWLFDGTGTPFVIDPAPLWGDPLSEMALSEMFGGFPKSFYDEYTRLRPFPDTYPAIRPIYQLYHWLVHLKLFGTSYRPMVQRTLAVIQQLNLD